MLKTTLISAALMAALALPASAAGWTLETDRGGSASGSTECVNTGTSIDCSGGRSAEGAYGRTFETMRERSITESGTTFNRSATGTNGRTTTRSGTIQRAWQR